MLMTYGDFTEEFLAIVWSTIGWTKHNVNKVDGEADVIMITEWDLWHGLRAMASVFQDNVEDFPFPEDLRQPPPVHLTIEQVVQRLISASTLYIDWYRAPARRRTPEQFSHCELCYESLFVFVDAFLHTITHCDFRHHCEDGMDEFCHETALEIAQNLPFLPSNAEDGQDCIDAIAEAIAGIDDPHHIQNLIDYMIAELAPATPDKTTEAEALDSTVSVEDLYECLVLFKEPVDPEDEAYARSIAREPAKATIEEPLSPDKASGAVN